jgi:spore coat polysaccharide biosynthesis protein SpsF (cytidylyltransferase family)/sialic acid synthase SpsE
MKPHIILETANFHGGDVAQIKQAIEGFSILNKQHDSIGIKFHAFKPENVMMPDFSWYSIIKDFFIDESIWQELIDNSIEKGFSVWLDLFCVYGVEILEKNLNKIKGIKLQPSILDNLEITQALAKVDLSEKELIINVAGLEITQIEAYLQQFRSYNLKRIVLQLGFQNHPTKIEDSSLKKIQVLKSAFPEKVLSYADHISPGDDGAFAINFPVYAYLSGCEYIEKHIANERATTEYDASAALEVSEAETLIADLLKVQQCLATPFITANEQKYYDKSIQKPVIKSALTKGQLVAPQDVMFRRTDKPGLNYQEMQDLQNRIHILNRSLEPRDTVSIKDYKKPRVATIVAVRMKSSRLKQKAILPINGMSSIERCLDNCFKSPYTDDVILATSTAEDDAVLGEYTLQGKAKFWQGDLDDVISRYLGACDKYGIDVIIRITGDCPIVSPEITEILIKSHFATGADFTEAKKFAVGTNTQIYNVEALKRVIQLVGRAEYSEHMTLYMTNNPGIFKVNYVDLPPELVRDYRLTLDYQEDLDMFDTLYKKLAEQNLDSTIVNAFKILDENPEIPKMNAHKTLVYKTDHDLIRLLKEKTTIKNK